MIIACIRHLESLANKRRRFCYEDEAQRLLLDLPGDNDVPLTQEGIEHGKRIQGVLSRINIFNPEDMDVSVSPYVRTLETSRILFPQYAGKVIVDTRLCERNNGWCAHMTQSQVDSHFPWLKEYWKRTSPLLATPPGGENMLDVVHRVRPVLAEVIASGRNRLFIGHGNLFKAIDFILQEMTFKEFLKIPDASNGSLTIYRNVHLGKSGMTIDCYHEVLSD